MYIFDKITIYTQAPKKRLEQTLPVKKLRVLNPSLDIDYANGDGGFYSKVTFVAPSREFIELLLEYKHELWGYKFNVVEMPKDHISDDEQGVIDLYDEITPQIRKKWSARKELISVDKNNSKKPHVHYREDDKVFGRPTLYFEHAHANVGLKAYCRYTKDTNEPAFRYELSFEKAHSIKKKTGIERLPDLLDYDPTPVFNRYIKYEEINYEEFGAWIKGEKKCRILQHKPKRKFEYNHKKRTAQLFLRILADKDTLIGSYEENDKQREKWKSVSQLRGYLLKEKKRIKKKMGVEHLGKKR